MKIKKETLKVNSAAIKTADYNYDNSILTLKFASGRKYNYLNVEPFVFEGMRNAPSIGKFINKYIIKVNEARAIN